jgi:glycosyltransferase involved in cell wall biosynthesis
MACGVPTISSNRASLPEISQNATIYFDPYSLEDIMNCIMKVSKDKKIRESLIEKGKKQVLKYDWDVHVQKLIEIYKKYY